MFRQFQTLAILATLFTATVVLADEKKKEGKEGQGKSADVMKLQGEWTATEGFEADMGMVIKDNKFTLIKEGKRHVTGTFTIDASKSPKTMDLTVTGGNNEEGNRFKGKVSKAIYEVTTGKFKWCAGEPGKEARPKRFAREFGLYVVFERKKE